MKKIYIEPNGATGEYNVIVCKLQNVVEDDLVYLDEEEEKRFGGFTSIDECLEFVYSEYKRVKNISIEVEDT